MTDSKSLSSGKTCLPLSNDQIEDLFNHVFQYGRPTDNDNQFSFIVLNSVEEVAYSDDGYDYYSVFINDSGWPVAAAAPLESLFRIMI